MNDCQCMLEAVRFRVINFWDPICLRMTPNYSMCMCTHILHNGIAIFSLRAMVFQIVPSNTMVPSMLYACMHTLAYGIGIEWVAFNFVQLQPNINLGHAKLIISFSGN